MQHVRRRRKVEALFGALDDNAEEDAAGERVDEEGGKRDDAARCVVPQRTEGEYLLEANGGRRSAGEAVE